MLEIFVSYSKDRAFAIQLASFLRESGAKVWIDLEGIPAGKKWSTAVQEGLEKCALMVLVLSPNSMASNNVEDEWQYFLDHEKPIIPLLLKQTEIHFQLSRIQHIDFSETPYEIAFQKLHDEILRHGFSFDPLPDGEAPVQSEALAPVQEHIPDLPIMVDESATVSTDLGTVEPAISLPISQSGQEHSRGSGTVRLGIIVAIVAVLIFAVFVTLSSSGISPFVEATVVIISLYGLLSILTSYINTFVSVMLGWRARYLVTMLRAMLDDPTVFTQFVTHPLIHLIYSDSRDPEIVFSNYSNMPVDNVSWIDPRQFSNVLIRILLRQREALMFPARPSEGGNQFLARLLDGIRTINSDMLREQLIAVIYTAGTFDEAKYQIEDWFNGQADTLAYRFKQRMIILSLMVALILSILLNVDTLQIVQVSFSDSGNVAASLPIGWEFSSLEDNACLAPPVSSACDNPRNLWLFSPSNNPGWLGLMIRKIIGILITAVAVSQSAPFLFDIMRRLEFAY